MMEYAGLIEEVKKYLRGHEDFYGHWHPLCLDTIVLGQLALCHLPNIDSYKLEIMCEHLGIELDDAHDADADVSATTNVAAVLTQRMRSVGGEIEGGPLEMSKAEKVENILRYNPMEEQNIQLQDVNEPEVKFKLVSDKKVMNIVNADINEVLVEISGYDLQINFNMQYLKSVEDIEAACSGIADLFRDTITEKLLEYRKQ